MNDNSTKFIEFLINYFQMKRIIKIIFTAILVVILTSCNKESAEFNVLIGWAIEDITPEGTVSLQGQYYERMSEYVQSPLKATALALEGMGESNGREQAIMITVDVVSFRNGLQDSLRSYMKGKITDFDVRNLFLNATHTHSSFDTGLSGGHRDMLIEKLSRVAVNAWENRKPGGISSQLRYAVVGHNRRVEYSNGSTEMYGSTGREDFTGLEGPENSGVDMLFCWDSKNKLTGIVMNVACPAQVTEAKYYVSADYWSEVRKYVEKKFSNKVFLFPQISAAGDLSPRDLPRGYKSGEPDMWDVPGIVEIGRRLAVIIDDAYPVARNSIQKNFEFKHIVKDIDLPARQYSEEEYKKALTIVEKIRSSEPADLNSPETAWNRFLKEISDNEKVKSHGPWDNKLSDFGIVKKQEALVKQYELQHENLLYPVEVHVLRLGDVVFATNPFELFADYGFRITGRSKAGQTFIIQLAGGDSGGYLPTKRAVEGEGYRGYSAMVNRVGPEGGDILVKETLNIINLLWEAE